jgi:hypothetical protein
MSESNDRTAQRAVAEEFRVNRRNANIFGCCPECWADVTAGEKCASLCPYVRAVDAAMAAEVSR